MKHSLSLFLIPSILVCATTPALVAQGGAEPLSCADRSITASAVRTPEDVQAFVQCAYEFVQEVGFEEARRAFHEDERWQHGPYYVFVDGIAKSGEDSLPYVYPPDPSLEGVGCGKGRNDTLSVEGPLFVVPRSSLHEALPTNTSLS